MNKIFLLIVVCLLISFTSCNPAPTSVAVVVDDVSDSPIEKLASDQLAAYNRGDLDGFCACYHADVQVFNGEVEQPSGIEAFRERYAKKFAGGGFGATVPKRIALGDHCVDLEHWWAADGKRGEVLVRYTLKDDLIGIVQFLR